MENEQLLIPEGAPLPGTYRHYKGPMYQVFGMAQHSETDEWMVIYQALYGKKGFWARPLSVWLSPVVAENANRTHDEQDSNESTAPSTPTVRFELVTPSNRSLTQLTK